MAEPVVDVRDVWRRFKLPRTTLFGKNALLTAVHGVSFTVDRGEIVGIVGESGSGKSTLSRIIVGLDEPDEGEVIVAGHPIDARHGKGELSFRRDVQIVFQDPLSSFDPRMRVRTALLEPLRSLEIDGDHEARVAELLDAVQLPAGAADKYPHEFSGGQRQRLAIARALAPRPKVLVADEPVSALDLSVQAQILNLILDLRDDFGLTVLIVAHDLGVVHHMSDRVLVMNTGHLVEAGTNAEVFSNARHPYTELLLGAIVTLDGALRPQLAPPAVAVNDQSCVFVGRCPYRQEVCIEENPRLLAVDSTSVGRSSVGGVGESLADAHLVECHFRDQPFEQRVDVRCAPSASQDPARVTT